MLSGKVPFRARSQTESAAEIIERIKVAEFSFDDEVWGNVSTCAKDLIIGLLTVDPAKRLLLSQVATHPWLMDESDNNCMYELQTPTILPLTASDSINETINCFKTANKDGFHLMGIDVGTAPLLVKRRGLKRRLERDPTQKSMDASRKASSLAPVPEGIETKSARPTTLGLGIGEESSTSGGSTGSSGGSSSNLLDRLSGGDEGGNNLAAFTEYRDTKPRELKYSRDL